MMGRRDRLSEHGMVLSIYFLVLYQEHSNWTNRFSFAPHMGLFGNLPEPGDFPGVMRQGSLFIFDDIIP